MIRKYERLHALFNRLGLRILKDGHHSDLVSSLRWIRRTYGIELGTLLDIGAHDGAWSRSFVSRFPTTKPFLIEANRIHTPKLEATGFPFCIATISDKVSSRDFFGIGGTGDSMYVENTSFYKNITPTRVQTITLDGLLEQRDWPYPDLIKIDTQGSELEVNEGASRALKQAPLLLVEHSLLEYNHGAPTFSEVSNALGQRSFSPWGAVEFHQHNQRLIQIDLLWINDEIIDS